MSENTSANSHNNTQGSSKGIGAGFGSGTLASGSGIFSGIKIKAGISKMLGISGGINKSQGESWTDSSQTSTRSLSALSDQQLRERTMQNASSVRSQRATVVTGGSQSESVNVTTEVLANHNHCHAITIQYFEVLRHFALYQELSDVQECLFVPMLIESFDRRKILRWRDILSTYLFAPQNKYFQYHAGFDALQRIEDSEVKHDPNAYVSFPVARFCDESFEDISGILKFRLFVVRPQHDIPAVVTPESLNTSIHNALMSSKLGSWWTKINYVSERLANTPTSNIEATFQALVNSANLVDEYINKMSIRFILGDGSSKIISFDITVLSKRNISYKPQSFASLSGQADIKNSFGDLEVILSLKPTTQTLTEIAGLNRALVRSIEISNNNLLPDGSTCMLSTGGLQYISEHYSGTLFSSSSINNDIGQGDPALIITRMNPDEMRNPRLEDKKNAEALEQHLETNKEYYHKVLWTLLDEQKLFNLLDKYSIQVPKVRYFTYVEIGGKIKTALELDNNGKPIIDYVSRSIASVIELKRMGMAGNSIIFPVARGFNLNPDFLLIPVYTIVENAAIDLGNGQPINKTFGEMVSESAIELIDLYKPLPGSKYEPKPYRVSVPTKGLFAEAVQGACNSCEKIDDTRFWKWEEHPIDEPTAINPISTDSRRSDLGNLTPKDFATPIVNIQNTPSAPDPQGLANALLLMGKADMFKDITGLTETQKNALTALTSNQEAAKSFAEIAAKLATSAGENATKAMLDADNDYDFKQKEQLQKSIESIKNAPISPEEKENLLKQGFTKLLSDAGNTELTEAIKQMRDKGKYDDAMKVIDKLGNSAKLEIDPDGGIKVENPVLSGEEEDDDDTIENDSDLLQNEVDEVNKTAFDSLFDENKLNEL